MPGSGSSQPGIEAAREPPISTRTSLERAAPLLACVVNKWLRARGKTARPKLTEEQRDNLSTAFRLMDADGSGAIDEQELGAAFHLMGLSVCAREVQEMLAEVDHDGSGAVEYAEFLEVMTLQLGRLAQRKEAAAAAQQRRRQERAATSTTASPSSDAHEAAGAAAAAALPFEVVATAYRRKKLLGALEADDKDWLLSVSAADEAERRKAEQEAAAAAAAAARRSRRGSTMPSQPGSRRPSAAAVAGMAALQQASPPPPVSHASFLDSLGKEQRRIIDALSRKCRLDRDTFGGLLAQGQQQEQQQQQQPHSGDAVDTAAGPAQHTATPAAAAAAPARSHSLQRAASKAVLRPHSFKLTYTLSSKSPAGAAPGF